MSPGLKSPLLLALYAVELLMVFLMAADGNRERLALGLGVQHSFNKSQSVQCHYINIFWSITAKVRWCSFAQEPVVCGHGRNIWRCKAAERKQKQDGRRERKKKPSAPESLQASSYKRWGFSNYLQAVLCDAYKYKQEGKYSYTRGNLQPFAIRENEIQVHKRGYTAMITACFGVKPEPARSGHKNVFPKVPIQ